MFFTKNINIGKSDLKKKTQKKACRVSIKHPSLKATWKPSKRTRWGYKKTRTLLYTPLTLPTPNCFICLPSTQACWRWLSAHTEPSRKLRSHKLQAIMTACSSYQHTERAGFSVPREARQKQEWSTDNVLVLRAEYNIKWKAKAMLSLTGRPVLL